MKTVCTDSRVCLTIPVLKSYFVRCVILALDSAGQDEVIGLCPIHGRFLVLSLWPFAEVVPLSVIRPNSVAAWIYVFIAIDSPRQQFRSIAPCTRQAVPVAFSVYLGFYRAAFNATWSSHDKAVCLSVCPSVRASVRQTRVL